MATIQAFEDLEMWKRSRELVRSIRSICKRKSVVRDFPFIDQITRAARSIPANIAEGFEALTNAQFIEFLGYAKRSCGEVRSHLYDALDEKYISTQEFSSLTNEAKHISSMIMKLIQYLAKAKGTPKRIGNL